MGGIVMSFVQIGNFTIQSEWLSVIVAFFVFMAVEEWVQKKKDGYLQDTFFSYLVIWKGSYVLFAFPLFMANPMSILYFSGGLKGHILGLIGSILLFVRKSKRKKKLIDWHYLLYSFVVFYALYQGVLLIASGEYVVAGGILLIYIVHLFRLKQFSPYWVYLFVVLNGIALGFSHQIFSTKGWTFIAVTGFLLLIILFKEKQVKQTMAWIVIATLVTSVSLNVKSERADGSLREKAIDFELQTLDGETIRLSYYEGKKVVLNFWATWCPPCKAEMPHLQKFYEEHHEEVEIIAVNLTSIDNGKDRVALFIEDYQLTFPIPLDEEGVYGDVYEAITIPTSYFIDTEGKIVQKVVGPMDEQMLERITSEIK